MLALKFAAVGFANTVSGLLVIYASKALFRLDDFAANALGYACGLILSFSVNRTWTFGHSGSALPSLLRFATAVLLSYGANVTILFAGLRAGLNPYVAQALGVPIYAVLLFLACKHFVFKDNGPSH